MAKIDLQQVEVRRGSRYPAQYGEPCRGREARMLSDAAGLTQFGVNLQRLDPGAWSSQRHWHTHEDELVYVLEGELVLVSDDGEEVLRAGDCAGFKAGVSNAHHLQNRSSTPALFINVGARDVRDTCHYADVDMLMPPPRYGQAPQWTRKDGSTF